MSDEEKVELSDETIKKLAAQTRQEIMNGFYQDVGRSMVKKILWGFVIIGIVFTVWGREIAGWIAGQVGR